MPVDDNCCELDSSKTCDNCFACLESVSGQDYARIEIAAVYMNEDFVPVEDAADLGKGNAIDMHVQPNIRINTLKDLKGRRRID